MRLRILAVLAAVLLSTAAHSENNVFWGVESLYISGISLDAVSVGVTEEPVIIEWDASTGAADYEICIGAEDVAGSGNVVGENCHVDTYGTSYTTTGKKLCQNAAGTQVWARVRSLLTAGQTQYNTSPWSGYLQITCSDSPTSPAPTTTTSTVAADDYVPNPFAFDSRTGAEVSTGYSSGLASMSGINVPASITITQSTGSDALFSINGGEWSNTDTNISNGSTLAISLTSSPSYSTARCATVTVNGAVQGVTGTYRVTTKAQPTTSSTTTTAAGTSTTTTIGCELYSICQNFEGSGYDNDETAKWTEHSAVPVNEDYTGTVLLGSQSLAITTSTEYVTVDLSGLGFTDRAYAFFRFQVNDLSDGSPYIFRFYSGSTLLGYILLRSGSNAVRIYNGAVSATGSAIASSTPICMWFSTIRGTSPNADSITTAYYANCSDVCDDDTNVCTRPASPSAQITTGTWYAGDVSSVVIYGFYSSSDLIIYDEVLINATDTFATVPNPD